MKKITLSLFLLLLIFLFLLFVGAYFNVQSNKYRISDIILNIQFTFMVSSISLFTVMFSKTPGAFETTKGQIIAVGIPSKTRQCLVFFMGIFFGIISYLLLLFLANLASFQPSSMVSIILTSFIPFYIAYKVPKLSLYGGEVLSFLIKSPPPIPLDQEPKSIDELPESKSDFNTHHSVLITSNGEIIRKTTSSVESSNLSSDQTKKIDDSIMWNFKFKKTRIIFLLSIPWVWFISYFHHYNFSRYPLEILIFTSPVWVYWVVIPLYLWIRKGK